MTQTIIKVNDKNDGTMKYITLLLTPKATKYIKILARRKKKQEEVYSVSEAIENIIEDKRTEIGKLDYDDCLGLFSVSGKENVINSLLPIKYNISNLLESGIDETVDMMSEKVAAKLSRPIDETFKLFLKCCFICMKNCLHKRDRVLEKLFLYNDQEFQFDYIADGEINSKFDKMIKLVIKQLGNCYDGETLKNCYTEYILHRKQTTANDIRLYIECLYDNYEELFMKIA